MDLADLRIFTTVVREGGVTRAAEKLNRVQSNVTTRIRQLEEDLDVAAQGRGLAQYPRVAGHPVAGAALAELKAGVSFRRPIAPCHSSPRSRR